MSIAWSPCLSSGTIIVEFGSMDSVFPGFKIDYWVCYDHQIQSFLQHTLQHKTQIISVKKEIN